jgi:hypothetical protein
MTRKLLPYEHDLIETLGVTEEEYLAFLSVQKEYNDPKEGTVLDVRNMPPAAPVVAGAAAASAATATATTLAAISLGLTVIGIIFQVAAVLLAESPSKPKNRGQRREQRFSPRLGFNSAQELAQYGDPINLVYCNTRQNSLGAVRVSAALVWSAIEAGGSSQFMQLMLVLGAASIKRLDFGRTAFGQLPLQQFSGSNVWLYYQENGRVKYSDKVLGDGKDPTRDGAASSEDVCRINDRKDGFSQAFSPSSLTTFGVYDPIPVNVKIQERRNSGRPQWGTNGITIRGGSWQTGNDSRYQKGESFTLVFQQARNRQDKVVQEAAKNLRYQTVESLDRAATYMLGTARFRLVSVDPDNVNLDNNQVAAKFECIEAGRRPTTDYDKERAKNWNDQDLDKIEEAIEQLKADATDATITGPGLIRQGKPDLWTLIEAATNPDDYKYTVTYGQTSLALVSKNYAAEGGIDSLNGGDIILPLKRFGGENYEFKGTETIQWETDFDARKNKNQPLVRSVQIPRGGSIAITRKILRSFLANKPKLDVQALRDEYNDDLERARQLIDDINAAEYDKELRKEARKNSSTVKLLKQTIRDKKLKIENKTERASTLAKQSKSVNGDQVLLRKGTDTASAEAKGIAELENDVQNLQDDIEDVLSGDVGKIKKVYIRTIRNSTSSFKGIDGNIYAAGIKELKKKIARLKGERITDQEGVRLVRRYLNELIKEKEEALNLAKNVAQNYEDLIAATDNDFYTKCLVKTDYAAYQTVTACDFVKFALGGKVFRRVSGRAKTYGQKDAPDGYRLSDNGYQGRLAFFTMSYRQTGANEYKRAPIVFAMRRASDQDNFIALNFKAAKKAKWEFKFEPVGDIGAELRDNNQQQFAFIENSGGGSSIDLADGSKVRWTGRLVNRSNAFKERGPIYTNEWDLFSVRSDTQTQFSFDNGPEFRITAVTEQQLGNIADKYDNMSMMAMGVYSGKGVQDLRSITAYVLEGKNSYIVNESTGAYSLSSSSTSYAPDIFADTVLDRTNGIGKYAKPEGIDWDSLALAKRFCKNNGLGTQLFMDGVIADLTSWRQFWVETAPFSLLEFARVGGKETLIPSIPTDNSGNANRKINISALFTTGNILEGSYKEEFIDYGDATQDIIATVIYRETESQDVFPRNASVQIKLRDADDGNALRQTFDASQFVTQKKQAILFGKLLCNQRRWIRRGIEFKTFPTDSPVSPGAYIYVDIGLISWDRITSGLIMEGGVLNAPLTDTITNGSYSILTYGRVDDNTVRSFDNVSVVNGTAASLAGRAGSLFVLGAKADRRRVFRVTEVQMDEEGEVTVKALEHPCDESGGLLLSKVANFSDSLFTVV